MMQKSGGGKTHALTFFGSQAIRRGYPVYHFAFGDMNQWEVSLRYAANFTGIDSYDIIRGVKSDYHVAALNWLQQGNKDLFVCAYPPDTITPGNLKSIISSMISRTGVRPAVVIVDYADNLATGGKYESDSSKINSNMGKIYQQLIKIAVQFDCVVWTGSQVQRSFYRVSSQTAGETQGVRYVPGLIGHLRHRGGHQEDRCCGVRSQFEPVARGVGAGDRSHLRGEDTVRARQARHRRSLRHGHLDLRRDRRPQRAGRCCRRSIEGPDPPPTARPPSSRPGPREDRQHRELSYLCT